MERAVREGDSISTPQPVPRLYGLRRRGPRQATATTVLRQDHRRRSRVLASHSAGGTSKEPLNKDFQRTRKRTEPHKAARTRDDHPPLSPNFQQPVPQNWGLLSTTVECARRATILPLRPVGRCASHSDRRAPGRPKSDPTLHRPSLMWSFGGGRITDPETQFGGSEPCDGFHDRRSAHGQDTRTPGLAEIGPLPTQLLGLKQNS